MEDTLRVSVRELVAFSYFAPDIQPGGGIRDMLAGTQAHQARESAQADEFEIEKSLQAEITAEGEQVTVFGRMDAYRPGTPPCVEEIKLCSSPPSAALPDHRAQALLYGAMLALSGELPQVEIRVVYVNIHGEPVRVFAELAARETLLSALQNMLAPWLAFAVREREHARVRDESLKALPFPFPAYRPGQRELARQVYTAITRKKRLFATLPTGTGKSAAVLFPALKALSEGKTRKILYLTARTTARQSPLNALELMRSQGMKARICTLTAKEKLCPAPARCHPDDCPRAKGHYLRQPDAIARLLATDAIWSDELIAAVAAEVSICPFELALSLIDLADVVLMDVNYAFDPLVQIARLFQQRRNFTVLADEAHHLLSRVRDSLSSTLDSREIRAFRTLVGKTMGRKHPFYKALTGMLAALREIDDPAVAGAENVLPEDAPGELESAASRAPVELRIPAPPETVVLAAQALCDATMEALGGPLPGAECRQTAGKLLRTLFIFQYAAQRYDERYATLLTLHGRERALELYCLSPAEMIAQTTKGLRGAVFFSATLSPLPDMRALLGGTEEDACFSLPSPFPAERLAVVRRRIQTRYRFRQETADTVAHNIAQVVNARPGKYIAYLPSYAYLRLILESLAPYPLPPLLVQESEMSEEARDRFLAAFTQDGGPKLGLCVLGGLFSEGVDLPGEQLIGALIVGVGLPTPCLQLRTLQAYYDKRFGDGFLYAWMIPAMQKVAQAAGRVIRTEWDRGLVLLMDDRYYDPRYVRLLPPDWMLSDEDIPTAIEALNRLPQSE